MTMKHVKIAIFLALTASSAVSLAQADEAKSISAIYKSSMKVDESPVEITIKFREPKEMEGDVVVIAEGPDLKNPIRMIAPCLYRRDTARIVMVPNSPDNELGLLSFDCMAADKHFGSLDCVFHRSGDKPHFTGNLTRMDDL
jgi:hypothetical protein